MGVDNLLMFLAQMASIIAMTMLEVVVILGSNYRLLQD